jgi:hypothetical protein
MIRFNDLIATAKLNLYEVREVWYGIDHDSPCCGSKQEYPFSNKSKGVYARIEDAEKSRNRFSVRLSDRFSGLDKNERTLLFMKNGLDVKRYSDWGCDVKVKTLEVQVDSLNEDNGRVYWNRPKRDDIPSRVVRVR